MASIDIYSNQSHHNYSENSIFFNLVLKSNYENTKENCLQFLQNFQKQIYLPKRELFKSIINEMTLSETVDKIGNDESIYLIRLLIKKYTRNNILNALYDFICENENVNDISAPFPDKLMNTPAQKSNKKSYHDIDETKICKMDIENGSIDNNFEFNLLADDEK